MKISRCSLAISLLLAGSVVSIAQNGSAPANPQPTQLEPTPCGYNVSTLSAAHQEAGEDGLIIAIARLGDGEQRREINRRRLHNVRVYLTEFDWHRAPETVITAEGERVRGYGRVELYVGGRLFRVLAVRPNRDLSVGSCEPDDERPVEAERNLYPHRDRRPRRR